ncbi:hypothetical protein R3P38DRAFT_2866650 [Favolaschia claudopus]|uniref:Peptidase C19 ubiquitin carboxyl-terminal hydrolase domain-containing protein n=1 Tax=Favolaschia claudopus TaxID=2862362 RepID=A0AAW0DD93_9AGAR
MLTDCPAVIDLTGDDDELPAHSLRLLAPVMETSLNGFAEEDEGVPPSEGILKEGDRLQISDPPGNNTQDRALHHLMQTFTALSLGRTIVYFDHLDLLLKAWETPPQADSVKCFHDKIVDLVQTALDQQRVDADSPTSLFNFAHTTYRIPPSGPPTSLQSPSLGHTVSIEVDLSSAESNLTSDFTSTPSSWNADPNSTPKPRANKGNDLLTHLSRTLSTYHADGSSEHQLIAQPSEVVTFEINFSSSSLSSSHQQNDNADNVSLCSAGASNNNSDATTTTLGLPSEPFTFPTTIHLDRFLERNLDLANETREEARRLARELGRKVAKRNEVGGNVALGGESPLDTLRSAIYYYENVAECDSPERTTTSRSAATKLKCILKRLDGEVRELDRQITALQAEMDGLWEEDTELMLHPYDLRAVLVHTGHQQIYSYLRDAKGLWWKWLDDSVIEVPEETVLSDPAVPYMLVYSCRQTDESEMDELMAWPAGFQSAAVSDKDSSASAIRMQSTARKRRQRSNSDDDSASPKTANQSDSANDVSDTESANLKKKRRKHELPGAGTDNGRPPVDNPHSCDIVRRSQPTENSIDPVAPLLDIIVTLDTPNPISHWSSFLKKATPLLALVGVDLNSDLVSFASGVAQKKLPRQLELKLPPATTLRSWTNKPVTGANIRYKLAIFNTSTTSVIKNAPGNNGRDYGTAPWHVWAAVVRPPVRGVVERAVFIWDVDFDEGMAGKRRRDVLTAQRNFYVQLAGKSPLYINKSWRVPNTGGGCVRQTCEWVVEVARFGFREDEFVLILIP